MTKFVPGGPPRFKHQRRGLVDMIRNRGVHALLFDPGLGKTAVCIDYACLLALKSPDKHAKVLVLSPLAAVDSWVGQAVNFATEPVAVYAEALGGSIVQRVESLRARGKGDYKTGSRRAILTGTKEGAEARVTLLTMNFDAFASRRSYKGTSRLVSDALVDAVKAYGPDLIVVDESHRLKGPSSNTSRAVGRLTRICRRRVILTGTVMPHSPLDVWAQWRFLNPDAFSTRERDGSRRPMSFGRFKERYAKLGGFMGKEIVGFQNLDEMQQVIAQNATTATKSEELDLPPVTDIEVRVDLSPAERRAYTQLKDQLATQLDSGALASVPNRLALMMRLRQITAGFLPDDSGAIVDLGDSKVRTIASIVNDTLAGERRVVVFAHFKYEIQRLTKALAAKGSTVLSITGSTPARDRTAIRARFGSDAPERLVLIAQVRTLSLAVNELVTASHAVFASLPERRDDITQARDRLDRIGQTKPVTIWTAIAPGTVDGVLLTSYRQRTNLESAMIKHIKEQTL